MSLPEGKIKDKLKRTLARANVWFFCPATGGFGKSGIPDFICCVGGRFLAIECKAPGKHPTALQRERIDEITQAGGHAFVYDGNEQVLANILRTISLYR